MNAMTRGWMARSVGMALFVVLASGAPWPGVAQPAYEVTRDYAVMCGPDGAGFSTETQECETVAECAIAVRTALDRGGQVTVIVRSAAQANAVPMSVATRWRSRGVHVSGRGMPPTDPALTALQHLMDGQPMLLLPSDARRLDPILILIFDFWGFDLQEEYGTRDSILRVWQDLSSLPVSTRGRPPGGLFARLPRLPAPAVFARVGSASWSSSSSSPSSSCGPSVPWRKRERDDDDEEPPGPDARRALPPLLMPAGSGR
jgi:hypothetical protein